MSTNADIVSIIRSSEKWNSIDVNITNRAILAKANSIRNKYVYQKLNRRTGWDSANLFTPLKINLEEVPLADFCDYQSECRIARSKYKLPKFGEGIFGTASQGLYNINRNRKFIEVSASRYENLLRLGIKSSVIYYWIFNDYLWVSDSSIETVILPVFIEEDVPKEFSMDCEEANDSCPTNPMELPFKCLGGGMEEDVINGVVQFYANTFKRAVEDHSSDDLDQSK